MENQTLNALQSELDFYRHNHTAMETEIRAVITDNQKLSQQVGSLLKEKLQHARESTDHGQEEELNRQVAMLAKERDSLHVLWQTSQRTIEALETELKAYQSYDTRNGQDHGSENRRGLELKVETAVSDYIELEKKYKELRSKFTIAENELKNKDKEITSYKERGKDLDIKIEELTKTVEELRIDLAVERKNCEEVKTQLHSLQKDQKDIVKREVEAKSKVAEALQLFDMVSMQKVEAHKKIKELTNELSSTKQILAKVRTDMESQFRQEFDGVREKYNEKVADMLQHIKNIDTELVEKGMLLNKSLREIKVLREENENYLKDQKQSLSAVEPKLALAEERMEAMYQELVSSERRNVTLVCEKQSLAMDIQRLQEMQDREEKRRDWEESLLKTQCDGLRMQVEHLQKSLEVSRGTINKLQMMMTSRTELNQKMFTTKEEELEEMNKHLEKQMELNKKWKESYIDMSQKLKQQLEDMHKENITLRTKLNLSKDCENSSTGS